VLVSRGCGSAAGTCARAALDEREMPNATRSAPVRQPAIVEKQHRRRPLLLLVETRRLV
jgi:hypothetical protein